jgi:hypothetical protein
MWEVELISSLSMPTTVPKGHRVIWRGPLFGRLSQAGQAFLMKKGEWQLLTEPPSHHLHGRLQFVWPNKSGPQFEMDDNQAPYIRPYPKDATDLLDDKLSLAHLLDTHARDISPRTIETPDEAEEEKLYFVKHRFGAQGKSVCLRQGTAI